MRLLRSDEFAPLSLGHVFARGGRRLHRLGLGRRLTMGRWRCGRFPPELARRTETTIGAKDAGGDSGKKRRPEALPSSPRSRRRRLLPHEQRPLRFGRPVAER
jgi:hypothetical protein